MPRTKLTPEQRAAYEQTRNARIAQYAIKGGEACKAKYAPNGSTEYYRAIGREAFATLTRKIAEDKCIPEHVARAHAVDFLQAKRNKQRKQPASRSYLADVARVMSS